MHAFSCQKYYLCAIIGNKKQKLNWLDTILFGLHWINRDVRLAAKFGGREFQLDCFRWFSLEHSII